MERAEGLYRRPGHPENGYRCRRLVILSAHAIETPRLLLNSACPSFPEGLANSSGAVGKYLLSHPTWQVFGTFDEPINAYKGIQMGQVMVQDYYKPDARGYVLLSYMMTPVTYANLSGDFVGSEYKQFLMDYPYIAAWWAHAEGLPSETNRVTLDQDVRDRRGLPAARVHSSGRITISRLQARPAGRL